MSAYPPLRVLNIVPADEPVVPSDEPDGAVCWPTVLFEGGEKAGKSYELALFSGCGEFSQTWWIEVGMEGTARMYGRVPGADYKIVRHSGSIPEIMDRIADIHRHAVWTNATGRKPILVVVDSGGAIWKITEAWMDWAARQTDSAKETLKRNPNAEIKAPFNIRNERTAMWNRFIGALNDIPAVKVITSRGLEVTKFENNQPTTKKGWSVAGHKEFGFDVDIWCRLARNKPAEIIGIRAVVDGIRAGDDAFETQKIRRHDFSLRWLVFDRYALDPATAYVRPRNNVDDARLADPGAVDHPDVEDDRRRQQQRFSDDVITDAAHLLDDARKCTDTDAFRALWEEASQKGWAQVPLADGPLVDLMEAEAKRVGELERQRAAGEPEPPAEPAVGTAGGESELVELLGKDKLDVIPADRVAFLSGLAGRLITNPDEDLQGGAREMVLDELRNLAALGPDGGGTLIDEAMRAGQAIVDRAAAA